MAKGQIDVKAENIFPIIKKFLYSDHEIFLRELVSNAVDASTKLKALSSLGEFTEELGALRVDVTLDEKKQILSIKDNGIGMSAEEIKKYIGQIAFSGAEEFVQKYQDKSAGIIGHFGLGFFSAFMVSEKVEVISKTYKQDKAAQWICEGNPDFQIKPHKKEDRGTIVNLYIDQENKEFASKARIKELLNKYCKFLPIPVYFKEVSDKEEATQINNTTPAWTKNPSDNSEEDYKNFYKELYPYSYEEPIFNIHLNVDYPFNLTGILYFPKLKEKIEVQKNKIQLYCNQVFVTDSVEGIVPEFLSILHGVIDSPDIPLNVSRSYLQSDANVKKISNHITKKVADKLESLYKTNFEDFKSKWEELQIFVEYGMLTEDKFFEKAKNFYLFQNSKGDFLNMEDYHSKVKPLQTNKDGKVVYLYSNDLKKQNQFIQQAQKKGYDVLLLNTPTSSHLIGKLEQENKDIQFARIDSNVLEKLIDQKEDELKSELNEDQQKVFTPLIEKQINKEQFQIQYINREKNDAPITIVRPEFMRRMTEMNQFGGGFSGGMPEMYELVVNTKNPLIGKILLEKDSAIQNALLKQATDLAKLEQHLLEGEELSGFIQRSLELLNEK